MRVLLLEPSNLEPRRGSGAFSIPLFFFLPHPIPLFLVILVSLIAPFVLKPKKRCLLIATLSSPQFTEQQIAAQTVIPAQNVIR